MRDLFARQVQDRAVARERDGALATEREDSSCKWLGNVFLWHFCLISERCHDRRTPLSHACRLCIAAGSMQRQLRTQPSFVPAAADPERSVWPRNNVDAGIAPACSAGFGTELPHQADPHD